MNIKSIPWYDRLGARLTRDGVATQETSEKTLEAISLKCHLLKKGGEPDVDRMSRVIIKEWQAGKII